MSITDNTRLLDDLEGLLTKQIDLVRRGAFAEIEQLAQQCGEMANEISADGLLERPEFKDRRRRIAKIYEDLYLALSARKNDTAEMLSRVRRGKRMLTTYRANV